MNNLVKVHNLNVYPLEEMFKGQKIFIKANDYIEMDYDEAVQFRGQYRPMIKDKGGIQDPKSYKYIKLDEEDVKRIYRQRGQVTDEETEKKFVCHVCSKEFLSKNGLMKHIKTKHLDAMIDDEARKELMDDEEIQADET